jgi:hypothetical protein
MKKITPFVLAICFLNCKEKSERNQYFGYILFEYSSNRGEYKIVNKSFSNILSLKILLYE